jgi:hypothetical protein
MFSVAIVGKMSYLLPASLLLVVLDEVLVPAAALLAVLFREG